MPCNVFAPDFLDCLAQEQAAAEIKKKLAEAILAGALSALGNTKILHQSTEYVINNLPANVKAVVIEMKSEGMFSWSEQQLQTWLDNQP